MINQIINFEKDINKYSKSFKNIHKISIIKISLKQLLND